MSRIQRTTAEPVGEYLKAFLKMTGLAAGLNTQKVFSAWDKASGAAKYTIKRFYRNGTLYVTMSSSVVSGQLYFRKADLIQEMNRILEADELFCKDLKAVPFVKELVIK